MTTDSAAASAMGPRSLAGAVLQRVGPLTDQLVRTIIERNPGYRAVNVVPHEDLWRSCHDNITRILQLIVTGRDVDAERDDYYDAARATGHRRAEQAMPLDDVLRSFRLGGRLIWDALIDEARRAGGVESDRLLDLGSLVWEVVDRTSSQVAAAYHETERQLVRADEQRKVALWEGLLSGRATDPAFAYEAARIVGLPEDGPYLVAAADLRADFSEVTRGLAEALAGRGIESAWHSRADLVVGLVALGSPDYGPAAGVLGEACDFRVGLSLVVDGLAEVQSGYRQAVLALRTLGPDGRAVVALEERLPEALLVDAPTVSQRLVELWLGPLLRLPHAERDVLLATLEHWVATAGSTARTAEAAHCHRNTVINRLRRVQAVTGRDLANGPIPLELALALRARRLR